MPPRFVYWTIIAGGLPTAFRATEREELLPTFQRLKEKHPDAEMRYFAQGKLWDGPEQAKEAREAARAGERPAGPPRGRSWRPGGEHRDPRQKFVDQKKERNQRWRDEKFEKKQRWEARTKPRETPQDGPPRESTGPRPSRPTGPASARGGGAPRGDWREKKPFEKRPFEKKPFAKRPFEKRPFEARGDRPQAPRKDHDPRSGPAGAGAPPRQRFDRPAGPKREWQDRPPKREWQDKPREDWRDKKPGDKRPFAPRGDWRDKPRGDRPASPKAHDPKSGPAGAPPKRAWNDRPPKPEWKGRPGDDRPKRPFKPRGPKS